MITTAAKNYILEHGFDCNYILLGSGDTPASLTDAKLETEEMRLPIKSSRYTNVLSFIGILSKQMPAANYTEIGIVRNGRLTKDSGNLLSRIVQSIVKSTNTMYLIKFKFTFTGFTNIQ